MSREEVLFEDENEKGGHVWPPFVSFRACG